MANNATDFDLDMINFSKCSGLIVSIVGLNYEIDKWLQNLTTQRNLMVTALECRDVRECYPEQAILIETVIERTESTLDLIRNLSRFTETKWTNISIKGHMLNV